MSVPSEPATPLPPRREPRRWGAIAALGAAALLAYANSFATPFVFDDLPAIVENPAIHGGHLGMLFNGDQPGGLTVSGRPVLALTLALNHAISGEAVWSYHAVNFAIHLGAGLLLFGIVRRTSSICRSLLTGDGHRSSPASRLLHHGDAGAFLLAALWLLHPLQTESVTYIVQRAESLAGFFYLLTLYAFVRAADLRVFGKNHRWYAISVGACALGMASKEVVVSAPLLVLLYDRTFVSGAFRAAWQQRRGYYVALAATWIVLAALVAKNAGRGGTAGFATDISPWTYLLTQCQAIVRYLALTLWPDPLIFDRGHATVRGLGEVLPQAVVLLALAAATILAVRRRSAVGFVGVGFFALLAPSSSFVPIATQTMAEHRMYLPLAAVTAAAGLGLWRILGARACVVAGAGAVAFLACTHARNRDYRSEAAIWADTVRKLPTNARAHNNLGQASFRAGRIDDAIASYQRALELQPKYPEPHYNLGVAFARRGEHERAKQRYDAALALQPIYPEAHNNLGSTLLELGRTAEALGRFETALAQRPDFAEAHHNLGQALLQAGRPKDAVEHFLRALQLKANYAEARYNLGNALAAQGQMAAALEQYRRALAVRPNYADAHVNAGNALLELNRAAEAVAHYEQALAANPALRVARENLAAALMDLERWPDAIAHYERLLATQPEASAVLRALGFARARTGDRSQAIEHYERYLRAQPGDAEARMELEQLKRRK